MRRLSVLLTALAISAFGVLTVDVAASARSGSFVARALPFPAMSDDIYYPGKSSCLDGIDGIHKVSERFVAPAAGKLTMRIGHLSGDWDLYALGDDGERLGASEQAQVLDGAPGEERVKVRVKRGQSVDMVVCNWLGEPEVTVDYRFVPSDTANARSRHRHRQTDDRSRGR